MVTLTVTRSRVAAVRLAAADLLEAEGWDAYLNPLMNAIDRAAGYVPGSGAVDAEDTSLAVWDALAVQLGDQWPGDWERQPGRTQAEVLAALRGAAEAVAR
ncbi:hypothetical protein ABT010_13155 [Streptomyces sp. NPDC002668]|uniref:DUF6197 family protein n=1 Tax=Streptomyces sp. NPDC002668 TaxID=3154422 RepID=UPI00331EA99A